MRMAGYCSTDLGAMVSEDETVCGPCEPREPIVPNSNCTASLLQSPPVTHLPIHSSLVPSQPMALAYPALQLFYLLPGEQGSPPVLHPVLSSLHHGQPLFLPPLTCGPTPLQKSQRGEFFRPWERVQGRGCSAQVTQFLGSFNNSSNTGPNTATAAHSTGSTPGASRQQRLLSLCYGAFPKYRLLMPPVTNHLKKITEGVLQVLPKLQI